MKMTVADSSNRLIDANRLIEWIARYRRVVVALSGGVDSSVVAAAAVRAELDFVVAVTAESPSVAAWQLAQAEQIASELEIEHHIVATSELSNPSYARNDGQRCFFCKQTLYDAIRAASVIDPEATILSGTNADDLGDYRPGIDAGNRAGVITPLADLGIGKSHVRELARHFGLSNSELAASPCLASRLAYGVEVTPERLRRVEQAEAFLREAGFDDLRVRLHENELARIEVPEHLIDRFANREFRQAVRGRFRSLGFQYVSVDLMGLCSGSMNRPLVTISGTAS